MVTSEGSNVRFTKYNGHSEKHQLGIEIPVVRSKMGDER